MTQLEQRRMTIEDLYREPGKAELVNGRIVRYMATGRLPNRVAFRIAKSLDDHATRNGRGEAYTDSMGFAVRELVSGRESFSPDASYYEGPFPANRMRFIDGPPTLAVEVRSENDYGPAAEEAMRAKRADYFAAGTAVVWDVDPEAELVRVHGRGDRDRPTTFGRGEVADAEPAVSGWRMAVDEIFP